MGGVHRDLELSVARSRKNIFFGASVWIKNKGGLNSMRRATVSIIAHRRLIYQNSNMTPTPSGHVSIFGLVFFLLKSPLEIVRQ